MITKQSATNQILTEAIEKPRIHIDLG